MKIKTRGRRALFVLAAVMSLGMSGRSFAFTPWSNVNGHWVSSDGKTTIKGAVEKGVTITKYQNIAGDINWKQVALDDISFAMVRLGYYDDLDPYFDENMKGAESVGIKTGVCFYGKAVGVEEAKEEAKYVLDIIKDYKVSYPVGYDIESPELLNKKLSKQQITEQVNAFCEEIEEAGYRVIFFGDNEWLTRYVEIRKIPYDVWYSRYDFSNNFHNRTIWRCTDRGKVSGIKGSVCLEFSFEDYDDAFEGTGWRQINGVEYYFEDYRMVKNRTTVIDGDIYMFDRNGIGVLR